MDLDALRFAKFSKLGDAISDWEEMTKKLHSISRDAQHDLKGKADKANWAGVNAKVSKSFIEKTAGEFGDAHTQANTIHNILKDTYGELKSYHKQLHDAIEQGLKKNLTVTDTGDGSFTVTMNIHPDRAAKGTKVPEHTPQDVTHLRDEVERILKGATDSDNSAAKALRLIVDQAKYGFSDAKYKDRDSAAHAIKAAEKMAKLMKKDPHELSNTELTQLNNYLAKYGKDPLFAEQLATSVDPKTTLKFYAGIADPYQNMGVGRDPKARFALAKQLQKNLGITLGTATLSDSANMQKWENDMVKLGPQRLGIDDAGDPLGYQVMSSLMRFGDYDDQFLNSYGDSLVKFDKAHNGNEDLNYWINNADTADLNFYGKGDRGRDPMTGFLEALGHNPEASTQFFAQPDNSDGPMKNDDSALNDHLKYLTKERNWWSDDPQEPHGYMAGQDALGHALEAATTGHAYGSHNGQDLRNADTAGVMEEVTHIYGSKDGSKMLHDHPELGDSLGRMAAAYIDDIDYSVSGMDGHGRDGDTFPGKYPWRADFGDQGAINFLSVLGQNTDSHNITTAAQHLYTLSIMDANPPTSADNIDNVRDALSMEGETRGILDNSAVQQATSDYEAESEEAKHDLSSAAGWEKMLAGAVIDTGGAAVTAVAPEAGFVVPLVGGAAKELVNQAIDDAANAPSPTEKSQMTSQEFYRKGADSIGTSYDHYLHRHPGVADQADRDNWIQDMKSAYYGYGSHENDYRGLPPAPKE